MPVADEEWKNRALETVKAVAEANAEFTADDVWATGLEKPLEARALGGIMSRAKHSGWIVKSGRSQKTTQPESHGADIVIWTSKIYKGL